MSAPAVTAPADATVRDTLRLLIDRKISSVFVTRQRRRVRHRHRARPAARHRLRRARRARSAARQHRQEAAADRCWRTTSSTAPSAAWSGWASATSRVRNARGKLIGAVTTRNLLRHRATTTIVLGDEIDSARDVAALAQAWSKLPVLAREPAGGCGRSAHDRRRHQRGDLRPDAAGRRAGRGAAGGGGKGPPPVPYAVLVLGSAGRGESLLAADQDNAIVYATGEPGGRRGPVVRGARHRDRRHPRCGRRAVLQGRGDGPQRAVAHERRPLEDAPSTAGCAASGPRTCSTSTSSSTACRCTATLSLGEAIWNYAYDVGRQNPAFIKLLSELARDWRAPVTLFGKIRTDMNGPRRPEEGRPDAAFHLGARAVDPPRRARALDAGALQGRGGGRDRLARRYRCDHRGASGLARHHARPAAGRRRGRRPAVARAWTSPASASRRARSCARRSARVRSAIDLVGEGRF